MLDPLLLHIRMPTTIGMTSFQAAIHYMHNYALILLHVRLYCWCCCWWQKHCLHANYYINKYDNLSWRVLQLLRINKNLWHGQSKYPHHRRMQNEWLCADNNKCAISTASVVVHGLRPPPPHRVIMAWSAGAVDGNTLLKEAQLTENYLTNWLRHDQPASQPSNRPAADRVSREEVVRTARRMKVVLDRGGGGGKTLVYYSLLCPFRLDENANQQTGKDHAIRFYSTRLWSCPVQQPPQP